MGDAAVEAPGEIIAASDPELELDEVDEALGNGRELELRVIS